MAEAVPPLVGLLGVLVLVLAGSAAEHLGQRVPDAAHEQGAEQVLEGDEGVVDAQQDGGQLEVDEEDDYAEVHECVRRGDEIRLLVQDEDDGGDDAGLGREAGLHELHGSWGPDSSDEPL